MLPVILNPSLLYLAKCHFLIWLKQLCMTFKKSYLTRRGSRTPANSKDGAINNNKLLLKIVNYSIATMSSLLGVGRGPELLWHFGKILRMYTPCQNSKKSYDPRKHPDRQQDGRMNRP